MDYNNTTATHGETRSRAGASNHEIKIMMEQSAPAFDALSHTSSQHPSTGMNLGAAAKLKGAKVRKVQSSAFVRTEGHRADSSSQGGPVVANKLAAQRINQNSGNLHHVPKIASQMNGGSSNSFKLTDAAYKKLTSNYTANVEGARGNHKQLAQAAHQAQQRQHDVRSQNSALQQKFGKSSSLLSLIVTPIHH